jgi:hypothetical protein
MTRFFTKTETLRRLRVAAKLCRDNDTYGMLTPQDRVEVGYRFVPVHADSPPQGKDAFGPDDDLSDFDLMRDAAGDDQVRQHGYVAHLYFSNQVELVDTVMVWLGTPDQEPVYLG